MNNFVIEHLNKIKKNNFSNPELELRVLLSNCSRKNELVLLDNFSIDNINFNKFKLAFQRRMNFEPVSKIFNNKEFWSLNFYVNHSVLDPRPESELLIQETKKYFTSPHSNLKICDLGTGSGCLAISLAKFYKKSKIVATDISMKAIKIAKKNAKKHFVDKQINFINCNWCSSIEKFDIVVSNPPYLSSNQYEECGNNIKNFEPKIAFLGGVDGLNSYRKISKFISSILNKNAIFLIEIGDKQTKRVKKLFESKSIELIKIVKDYQQIDRVLVLKKI